MLSQTLTSLAQACLLSFCFAQIPLLLWPVDPSPMSWRRHMGPIPFMWFLRWRFCTQLGRFLVARLHLHRTWLFWKGTRRTGRIGEGAFASCIRTSPSGFICRPRSSPAVSPSIFLRRRLCAATSLTSSALLFLTGFEAPVIPPICERSTQMADAILWRRTPQT